MVLTEQQREFLNEVHFAVVATIASDGMPHQTVMWYEMDGDEVLLNTPYDSLKHRHLKRDPRISVCVEKAYIYVTLKGTVTLDEDPARARADYQRLGRRYQDTLTAAPPPPSGSATSDLLSRERVTIRMRIDKVISNRLR
ncbi:MAG: PPOX class F420-dependent oxidoreductase [Anaerolineae bacterium]